MFLDSLKMETLLKQEQINEIIGILDPDVLKCNCCGHYSKNVTHTTCIVNAYSNLKFKEWISDNGKKFLCPSCFKTMKLVFIGGEQSKLEDLKEKFSDFELVNGIRKLNQVF